MRETYGLSIMAIDWEQQTRVEVKSFTMEDAMMMLQEAQDPNLQALLEVILDPEQEELAAQLMGEIIPELGTTTKVRQFREKGAVEWEQPYIFSSKPVVRALEPWEDIIFPIQTDAIQRAPFIARRELLNEFELRERAAIEGWDQEWVERAVKHKGELKRIHLNIHRSDNFLFEQLRDLIEVWHVYRKEHDERTNATKVTRTVISWNITDKHALHELMPYEHQMYPFVELPRERNTRPLLEARGIPEIVQTAQEEVKIQRDFRMLAVADNAKHCLRITRGFRDRPEHKPAVDWIIRCGQRERNHTGRERTVLREDGVIPTTGEKHQGILLQIGRDGFVALLLSVTRS